MKSIKSATLEMVDAVCVDVEASFSKGLPSFAIVGMVSAVISESKDRVKSALLSNDYTFPPKKIVINLSPSDTSKSGSHFDLSIALLIALYEEKVDFKNFFVFGELGLDGKLKDTKSIFPLVLSLAKEHKNLTVLVPLQSANNIAKIANVKVYAVQSLNEAMEFFKFASYENKRVQNIKFDAQHVRIHDKEYFYKQEYDLNYSEVKGQVLAKQAALICASGNHNILFEGSPGCGKSMIIKRLPYIMPPLCVDSILEKAKLECLDNKEPHFSPLRVFRNPHHTSTRASIFGGGCSFQ
jgi:magnesium chelatase family protein